MLSNSSIAWTQSAQQYNNVGYTTLGDSGFAMKYLHSSSAVVRKSIATGRNESLMVVLYCKQLAAMRRKSPTNSSTVLYRFLSSLSEHKWRYLEMLCMYYINSVGQNKLKIELA